MTLKLDDFVAVVTGGSQGIGRAICQELLQSGASVMIADIEEYKAQQFMNDAEQHGFSDNRVCYERCDVRKQDEIHALLEKAKEWKGRLDIVVNCAGIFSKETFRARDVILTKLVACVDFTNKAIELMSKKNGRGHSGGVVVNVSAAHGLKIETGVPPFQVAAEHGVVAFTRSMGNMDHSTADGVRVNCLCPSNVETANARYNWERRPSTQAFVARTGKVELEQVVRGFIKCVEGEGNAKVFLVDPHDGIVEK